MGAFIEVYKLQKNYTDGAVTQALADISFEIRGGEFVAIMGPSGSGKSTLLHILSFLDRPTAGSYLLKGKAIEILTDRELAAIRNQEMGFVFQAFNLLGRFSVYENVELPLLYSGIPRGERKSHIEAAVAAVGLSDKLNSQAANLSGGQKQRVAIARALVNDPSVIFADEPTGNLDSKSGCEVMQIFESLHDKGRTIILVTHETYTAEFAERLIRLKDGRIEADEPMKQQHPHVSGIFVK
ncbi:MAG: ABC transporter ATP-binding protein [Candidatus Sungbacteria bacterium]|nr:ABC transporter ATP-binding protein [Candidatus Sungbacteria bacterium]